LGEFCFEDAFDGDGFFGEAVAVVHVDHEEGEVEEDLLED